MGSVVIAVRQITQESGKYHCTMHTDTTHTSLWTYMLPVLWKDRDGYRKNTDFNNSNIVAPHSSTLAWKIPWMEETGGLQSMGSLRVGHD